MNTWISLHVLARFVSHYNFNFYCTILKPAASQVGITFGSTSIKHRCDIDATKPDRCPGKGFRCLALKGYLYYKSLVKPTLISWCGYIFAPLELLSVDSYLIFSTRNGFCSNYMAVKHTVHHYDQMIRPLKQPTILYSIALARSMMSLFTEDHVVSRLFFGTTEDVTLNQWLATDTRRQV